MLQRSAYWCLVALLLFPTVSAAQDARSARERQRTAFHDPIEAGADFLLQGEYQGLVQISGQGWRSVGLQIIARGDGEFEAVQLMGGLPGDGWDGSPRIPLTGSQEGPAAVLEGHGWTVRADGRKAVVRRTGSEYVAGEMIKLHRISPREGAPPPPGAIVLFGGRETDLLKNATITEDGLLNMGTETVEAYRDFTLHVEFRTPFMPYATGQGRGNSGVYLQGRYEVQILDSFGLEGLDNECGGLYKTRNPDVHMCLPPLSWQTYDIQFRAARFDDEGNKTEDARITVWHNGVIIHNNVAIPAKTGGGAKEAPHPLPTKFQNHRDPVHFRNIWIVDHDRPSVYPPQQPAGPQLLTPVRRPRNVWGWPTVTAR